MQYNHYQQKSNFNKSETNSVVTQFRKHWCGMNVRGFAEDYMCKVVDDERNHAAVAKS